MNLELSILHGTYLPYEDEQDCNSLWFREWTDKMKIAFDDIAQLRRNEGNLNLQNLTNQKLVTILLYKSICIDTPELRESVEKSSVCDVFDCYQQVFPEYLSWEEFFYILYKLKLVKDFLNVYHLFSRSAKLIILVHAKEIYRVPATGVDAISSLNIAEKMALLISLIHHTVNHPEQGCPMLFSTMNDCIEYFEKSISNNGYPQEFHENIHKWLRSELSQKQLSMSADLNLDFLSIFEIKNSMSYPGQRTTALLKSTKPYQNDSSRFQKTGRLNYEFYEKLIRLSKSIITHHMKNVNFDGFDDVKEMLKELMLKLESCGKCETVPKQQTIENDLPEHDVVKYGLSGYENVANRMLKSIFLNISKDWKADVEIISSNPNCAATKDNLLSLISCLHFLKRSSDKCNNSIEKLWNVFFVAFKNMSLKKQTNLVSTFFSDNTTLDLLSERALLQQKHSNIQERSINTFLNHIDSDEITENQLSMVCYLLFLSPKLALEKMLYQGLNKAQQKFFINMFSKLPLLFSINFSKYSCICEYFCAVLNCFWINNENVKFLSTLQFLIDILSVDKSLILCSDLLDYILKCSLFNGEVERVSTSTMLVDVAMHILLAMRSVHRLSEVCSVKKLSFLCYRIAAVHDEKIKLWLLDYSSINVDSVTSCKDTLSAMLMRLLPKLRSEKENKLTGLASTWLVNSLKTLSWKTQILCHDLFKHCGEKIEVPECVMDVCDIESNVLVPTNNLTYGEGTGLIAWAQCFSEFPPLCPVSRLKVHQCSWGEIQLFEKGWTVMLCQVLPYSTPASWKKLFEATRMLIIENILYIPYTNTAMKLPVAVNLTQCRVVLALLQILSNINLIIFGKFSFSWYTPDLALYYVMQFCGMMSIIVNHFSDFYRSTNLEKIYMLTQMFYCGCQLYDLLERKQQHECIIKSKELLFIFLLHVIKSVEENMQHTEGESGSDSTTSSSSSIELSREDSFTQKFVFCELIEVMQSTSGVVTDAEKSRTMQLKFSGILESLME